MENADGRATSVAGKEPVRKEVQITRTFAAPRAQLFQAWLDPKQLALWWGPHGFTNPVCDIDARPGGAMRIVMRAPDGVEYPMTGVFNAIVPPERIVFTSVARDSQDNPLLEATSTVNFTEQAGGTKLIVQTSAVGIAASAPQMLAGMEAGWTQSLEKLSSLIENSADREIITTRIFAAPRELLFKAWSDPEHLKRWWGPKGFSNTFHEFDFRPAGNWRFVMHSPDGKDYPNHSVFVAIDKPQRIILRHLSKPQFQVTATFEDLGGKTKQTFRMLFESAAECADVKRYAVEANEQNCDRLAAELQNMEYGDQRR
jgi:uncharacterized protein YndB with AHSA1/START domain